MITTADALDLMAIVAACHPRTAPRMDDEEAAVTTATVWAELFNAHNLTVDDLAEGVKNRAASCAEAPEPADIINAAKVVRRERTQSESRAEREARQAELDAIKPAPEETQAIAAAFVVGPAKMTPRLKAADDALHMCVDKASARAAIQEFFEAKAEAQGRKPKKNTRRGSAA
ncbi:hypothetical protein ACNQR9_25895 [Mycolicibacterium peregrinum]